MKSYISKKKLHAIIHLSWSRGVSLPFVPKFEGFSKVYFDSRTNAVQMTRIRYFGSGLTLRCTILKIELWQYHFLKIFLNLFILFLFFFLMTGKILISDAVIEKCFVGTSHFIWEFLDVLQKTFCTETLQHSSYFMVCRPKKKKKKKPLTHWSMIIKSRVVQGWYICNGCYQ